MARGGGGMKYRAEVCFLECMRHFYGCFWQLALKGRYLTLAHFRSISC